MKSKIGQFFLLAAVVLGTLSTSVSAQTRSGQVFEDHTKVQKLTGTVLGLQALECPSGTVYSGGACVLISNQNAGIPSWVKGFIGQTKCLVATSAPLFQSLTRATGCVEILQSGEVKIYWNLGGNYQVISPVPWQATAVNAVLGACGVSYLNIGVEFIAKPIYSNPQVLNGSAPYDWEIDVREYDACYQATGGSTAGGID